MIVSIFFYFHVCTQIHKFLLVGCRKCYYLCSPYNSMHLNLFYQFQERLESHITLSEFRYIHYN